MSRDDSTITDESRSTFDKAEFAALFFQPEKNRRKIMVGLAEICRRCAQSINARSPDDIEEFKGDALILAMEIVDKQKPGSGYDPARGTAYDYFYSVIKHHMYHLSKSAHESDLGEADGQVAFDDLKQIEPQDVAKYARKHSMNNWRSFRMRHAIDKFTLKKFFRVQEEKINKAMIAVKTERGGDGRFTGEPSRAELAVLKAWQQQLRQYRRALVGEN